MKKAAFLMALLAVLLSACAPRAVRPTLEPPETTAQTEPARTEPTAAGEDLFWASPEHAAFQKVLCQIHDDDRLEYRPGRPIIKRFTRPRGCFRNWRSAGSQTVQAEKASPEKMITLEDHTEKFEVAFLAEEGNTQPFYFVGYGEAVQFQIHERVFSELRHRLVNRTLEKQPCAQKIAKQQQN